MGAIGERLFQFLLPPQCICCEGFLEEGQRGMCPHCLSGVHWMELPYCSLCGMPFASSEMETHLCGACLTRRKYFFKARALGFYEGALQKAIHRWKYEGKTYLTPFFGKWMAEGLSRYWEPGLFDLLIPVPLHQERLRERGFNQALLLVKELSHRTEIPYLKRVLRKTRPTMPQVNLSGKEREKGVKRAFFVMGKEKVEGKSILLVDDVYTTGATVNECSKALMAAGAKRVDVLTVAHAIKKT